MSSTTCHDLQVKATLRGMGFAVRKQALQGRTPFTRSKRAHSRVQREVFHALGWRYATARAQVRDAPCCVPCDCLLLVLCTAVSQSPRASGEASHAIKGGHPRARGSCSTCSKEGHARAPREAIHALEGVPPRVPREVMHALQTSGGERGGGINL